MWFKHRAWLPVAWLLSLVNLLAVWFAARPAEPWHAMGHALLAVLFGLGAQHLRLRKRPYVDADVVGALQELEARLSALGEGPGAEGRLAELEERLDFTERALAEVRNRVQLPRKE